MTTIKNFVVDAPRAARKSGASGASVMGAGAEPDADFRAAGRGDEGAKERMSLNHDLLKFFEDGGFANPHNDIDALEARCIEAREKAARANARARSALAASDSAATRGAARRTTQRVANSLSAVARAFRKLTTRAADAA